MESSKEEELLEEEENSASDMVVLMQPEATFIEAANLNKKPGLKCLENVEQLVISQHVDLLELVRGTEETNKYLVTNGTTGDKIFHAVEESSFGCREYCGKCRALQLRMFDVGSRFEGLALSRPFRCGRCCFPCCLQQIEVTSRGAQIGHISQDWHPFRPSFTLRDAEGEKVASIKGPLVICSWISNPTFDILIKETKVGLIERLFTNWIQEIQTDAVDYKMSFPLETEVTTKALLLAAVFLIDFMHFSKSFKCCKCCCVC